MVLIIGGAYQGKLDYAKRTYLLKEKEIFICSEQIPVRFDFRCIHDIQKFTLWCVRNRVDAVEYFRQHEEEWKDSILICQDIFCGVVPIDKEMRAWREMTGRLCAYLSSKAEEVVRIFCGLEQKIK